MRLYFEVRSKSRQHLGVLPVHLHVVDLAVETDGIQKSLEGRVVKKKAVSAQATSKRSYSTHSRWLKFLEIICKQVLPISFLDKSTRVILFMLSKVSISSAHYSPIPFRLKLTILRHLMSTIRLKNYLRVFFENPYIVLRVPRI